MTSEIPPTTWQEAALNDTCTETRRTVPHCVTRQRVEEQNCVTHHTLVLTSSGMRGVPWAPSCVCAVSPVPLRSLLERVVPPAVQSTTTHARVSVQFSRRSSFSQRSCMSVRMHIAHAHVYILSLPGTISHPRRSGRFLTTDEYVPERMDGEDEHVQEGGQARRKSTTGEEKKERTSERTTKRLACR